MLPKDPWESGMLDTVAVAAMAASGALASPAAYNLPESDASSLQRTE